MHTTMIEIARSPTWGLTADCRAAMGLPQAPSPLQSSPQAGQVPRGLFLFRVYRDYTTIVWKRQDSTGAQAEFGLSSCPHSEVAEGRSCAAAITA